MPRAARAHSQPPAPAPTTPSHTESASESGSASAAVSHATNTIMYLQMEFHVISVVFTVAKSVILIVDIYVQSVSE